MRSSIYKGKKKDEKEKGREGEKRDKGDEKGRKEGMRGRQTD
jgi:hypothetical protein